MNKDLEDTNDQYKKISEENDKSKASFDAAE